MEIFKHNKVRCTVIFIIGFVIFGCVVLTNASAKITGNSKEVKAVTQMIKQYKTKLYNIPNYNTFKTPAQIYKFIPYLNKEFKQYFTDKGFKTFMNNRIPVLYGDAAVNSKLTMKLESISFDKIAEDKKTSKITIDYTTKIGLKGNNKMINFKESGQIIIKNQDNKLLIDNDWISISKELMGLGITKKTK